MRVIVPYTDLHRDADAALRAYAPAAERVNVSGDDEAYWRLLRSLWACRQDFAVVEHDVIIGEGTIEALEACPEPWCGCPDPGSYYDRHTPDARWGSFFQCVRFRSVLMTELPDAVTSAAWMPPRRGMCPSMEVDPDQVDFGITVEPGVSSEAGWAAVADCARAGAVAR